MARNGSRIDGLARIQRPNESYGLSGPIRTTPEAVETGQMCSVETGQMSAVETGQMTAAETSVLSQQKKAQVQSWWTKVPIPSQNIKFGPKWVENRRFGLKLGPEACQDRSGAFGTGLTHSEGPSPAWSWRSKSGPQCRFGPKSSKMARNGVEDPLTYCILGVGHFFIV